MKFILKPGQLTLADLRLLMDETTTLELDPACHAAIHAAEKVIHDVLSNNETVYGINTGFGLLAHTRISDAELEALQTKIVLSHACGVGDYLADEIVRLMLVLKINSLARGFSGVRLTTIEALIALYNARIYPCVPAKGSVGASGDLAPLAHLCAVLIGAGEARHHQQIISAHDALNLMQLKPLTLAPKEGLALLNGTQTSTAIAIAGLFAAEKCFIAGIAAGAMSVDAACGSDAPFDARIQAVRGHQTQMQVAQWLRELLTASTIRDSHLECRKVQDPYSLRCQPQVMGACLAQLQYAAQILITEANGVSDNPLIFSDDGTILSGGNFHAEPVAMAADALAVAITEIGTLSERRIALLIDPHFNGGLPAFLVNRPGLNSGFMIAHVTAAALASENKTLAHPASVDTIPTSANQEDHVSMATFAANRLLTMAANTGNILAIELLAACQGLDLRRPLTSSPVLENIHQLVRAQVARFDEDRFFAPDIARAANIVNSNSINKIINLTIFN